MGTVLIGVLACAVILGLGGLRPVLRGLVHTVFSAVTDVLAGLAHRLETVREAVTGSIVALCAALAYGDEGPSPVAPAWNVLAPVVYGCCAVLIVLGDLVLAGLRFGALLGFPAEAPPVSGSALDLLAGLLLVAVIATFGLTLLDVLHVTPTVRPYGTLRGGAQRLVTATAGTGTALAIAAGVAFMAWGDGALAGTPNAELSSLFTVVFAVLLVVSSILAVAGALGLPLVVLLAVLAVAAGLLALVGGLLGVAGIGLAGAHDVAQAVVLLVTAPGAAAWNWFAGRSIGRRLGLAVVPPPENLPPGRRPSSGSALLRPATALAHYPPPAPTDRPARAGR